MSYTVFAVKWRPRRFDELVGQTHVVTALVNSLEAGRLHHAYLFSGTRGVGKTTIARILAKALNCEKGVTAEPCGECAACVAIDEGRFIDLLEVDAASRTKVDDTRELLDNVQYMPSRGRFKVYLIDEVHMLSSHSFNALLKTLEEPPPHVKFLFATTDPQKLPVTVLSRCLQFNLKKLPLGKIQSQLAKMCAAEGIEAEEGALNAIARAAAGSMRDAQSLLDQGVAFGGGRLAERPTKAMLGTIDRGHVTRLAGLLADLDGAGLLDEIAALDEMAPDYGAVLDELMAVLQRIAIAQLVGEERLGDDDAALVELGRRITPEDVQLYYQIAANGRRDLAFARDERISFEMTLLRMLAFTLEEGDTARDSHTAGGSATESRRPARRDGEEGNGARRSAGAHALTEAAADWPALVKSANLRGPVRSLAEHCVVSMATDSRLDLTLAADKSGFNTERLRERLETALGKYIGDTVKVRITIGEPERATPAQIREDGESARVRAAREAIENDPTVRELQAAFDAVLEPESIQPTRSNGREQQR